MYMLTNDLLSLGIVGGWVGRWCGVASSTGAAYYFGIWQGPAVLAAGAGRVVCFYFFISSILSSFSYASSLRRRLDIEKYCGLGRYNPKVVTTGDGLA